MAGGVVLIDRRVDRGHRRCVGPALLPGRSALTRARPVPSGADDRSRSTSSWWVPGRRASRPRSPRSSTACAVVCVDKATFPRDKTCGDGLTANALRLLETLGLTCDDVRGDRARVRARDRARLAERPAGRAADARPTACTRPSSRAATLDAALVALARRRGGRRARGCARREGRRCTTTVVVTVDDGACRRAVRHRRRRPLVDRCGARSSPTRRAISASGTRSRQYFDDVADERLWVAVRTRPAARLRVGVPAAGRRRQRRLRRAALRRSHAGAS